MAPLYGRTRRRQTCCRNCWSPQRTADPRKQRRRARSAENRVWKKDAAS